MWVLNKTSKSPADHAVHHVCAMANVINIVQAQHHYGIINRIEWSVKLVWCIHFNEQGCKFVMGVYLL